MNILVTGASGFLGSHLCRTLREQGHEVTGLSSKDCDLTVAGSLEPWSSTSYQQIYHLAAWTQAGDFCLYHPGEQWLMNQQMNTNVLSWWKERQPEAKLIAIGSSCCYEPGTPHQEENFLRGLPIDSLFTYAMTKRMLYAGMLALHKQFGLNYLFVVPSTLYGPDYHLDGRQMHFIFDLMRKIVNGKYHQASVELWGDGSQKRELIHVQDFVDVTTRLAMERDNDIVNIGGGTEHSIRHFAEILCRIIGYDPTRIQYDPSKYVGAKSKVLEIGKLRGLIPQFQHRDLEVGMRGMVDWYLAARAERKKPAATGNNAEVYLEAGQKALEAGKDAEANLLFEKAAQHDPNLTGGERALKTRISRASFTPFSIDQFVTSFAYGDGVGNCIRLVRSILQEWGFPSHIFSEGADPRLAGEWHYFPAHQQISSPRNLILYHPSDGRSAIIPYLRAVPDRKVLYYHNITPSEFFEPWDKETAQICRTARDAVAAFSDIIPEVVCDSAYNSADARSLGYRKTTVLPLPFFKKEFSSEPPDENILQKFNDGKTNVLFVGRFAPNKCQHDAIKVFREYKQKYNPHSRLILAGSATGSEAYTNHLQQLATANGADDVIVTGHISFSELLAFYHVSKAFLCLSEHEGFCLPLLEAMHFRLPILAFAGSAVSESLGGCSPMVSSKDPANVAQALHNLVSDPQQCAKVVEAQLGRLERYTEERFRDLLADFISQHLSI